MTVYYKIAHDFHLTFQSRSRFFVTIKIPWLVENDYQRIVNIKTNPPAKIKRVKKEGWELLSMKYSLDLPPRGSRAFNIETQLARLEFALPAPLSEINNYPFTHRSRLPSQPQWPTNIEELYKTAVESVQEYHSLLEVYISLYKKTRELIAPENLESRIGAYKAFKTGYGDCDEMTDLFITFCRCLGIPARRVTGYYVHKDEEIRVENHAWAEVPCPGTDNMWLPVDPAMLNFARLPQSYIAKKIEASISQVDDMVYTWRGRSTIALSSNFTEEKVKISVLRQLPTKTSK
ncbi:MAG: transglutaminase family protein [Candidatus Odinarchaeota archaeon]